MRTTRSGFWPARRRTLRDVDHPYNETAKNVALGNALDDVFGYAVDMVHSCAKIISKTSKSG